MRNLIWTLFKLAVIGFVLFGIYTYFVPETDVHTVSLDSKDDILEHLHQ